MRLFFVVVVLGLLSLTGCGGGGGGSDSSPGIDPGDNTVAVFTTELLDSNPTLYYYSVDDNNIEQEVIKFTGSGGTYNVNWNDFDFNLAGEMIFSANGQDTATLQPDGTLKFPDGSVLTLLEQTSTYVKVTGTDADGPWTDTWYFSPPEGWLTVGGGIPDAIPFTAELLNSNPTLYYINSEPEGIEQEVIKFSGSGGTYTINWTNYDHNTAGELIFSEVGQATVILQPNGTLLANGVQILTLLEQTATYLKVTGTDEEGPWIDFWHFSPPEGWIPVDGDTTVAGFTTALLDTSPTFYVQYPNDIGGTHQEVIQFTGAAGTYTIKFADYDFDSENNLILSESDTFSATLQDDGTLLVNLPGATETLSLLEQTGTYIRVTGANEGDPWVDLWHFSSPEGWITVPN
jgi:hypothetical protein